MKRTTIQADEPLLLELRQLADEQGMTTSQIIREALKQYLHKHQRGIRTLSFAGVGSSGRKDISTKAEELLTTQVKKETGWGS